LAAAVCIAPGKRVCRADQPPLPKSVCDGRTGQTALELSKHGKSGMTTPVEQGQFDSLGVARWRTQQFQERLEQTRNILLAALDSKHAIDWEELIEEYSLVEPKPEPPLYYESRPTKPELISPEPPSYIEYSPEPQRNDEKYRSSVETSLQEYAYVRDYEAWAKEIKQTEAENQRRYDENVAAIERCHSEHEQDIAKWHKLNELIETENRKRRDKYETALEQWHIGFVKQQKEVAKLKSHYEALHPEAIDSYCKLVLKFSKFCDGSQREFNLEYLPETKILIVDHSMPAPDDLVRIKEVKYVKSTNEFVELLFSDNEFNHIYDDIIYQTCLRTLYELFDADVVGALGAVVFNGWVESVDKATGRDSKGCVLSVQARKEEFQRINLARVEPKACFKSLKGIGSSTLHSLTPIAPVLKINRDDKRFIASHEVAGRLDERFNLAAMDWEDFEHLIRELFEKEFSKPGCEVRVTQASRDGGVDSVVFDPDPIHGRKTVIQAKRYTNIVGVAAVRELYGTVLNEGAMKGILVTTADYGPDAYEFAADKPLVILNGANLLSLLEKHGHKAKIDLQEAKRILGEKV
jgi:restriction system protein